MTTDRELHWEGSFNVRDLGGLQRVGGGLTRTGSLIRGDSPDRLTPAGWSAMHSLGVGTIVDLRNDDEVRPDRSSRPASLVTLRCPLDDSADTAFWEWCWKEELDGSPLYYRPFLQRKSEQVAAVLRAIARAPGPVLFHCVGGRDRTGLVSVLLLALVHVEPEEIARDYELSTVRLSEMYEALGEEDQSQAIAEILERKGTTARDSIIDLLEEVDVEAYLRDAGLSDLEVQLLRQRLVGTAALRDL